MVEWFDDLALGMRFRTGEVSVTKEDIKRFAAEFDPQPFHLDETAAEKTTQYGGWTTCVRATAHGITGRSLGTQTYLVNIEHDQISQREHVDGTHWCAKQTYQSL